MERVSGLVSYRYYCMSLTIPSEKELAETIPYIALQCGAGECLDVYVSSL